MGPGGREVGVDGFHEQVKEAREYGARERVTKVIGLRVLDVCLYPLGTRLDRALRQHALKAPRLQLEDCLYIGQQRHPLRRHLGGLGKATRDGLELHVAEDKNSRDASPPIGLGRLVDPLVGQRRLDVLQARRVIRLWLQVAVTKVGVAGGVCGGKPKGLELDRGAASQQIVEDVKVALALAHVRHALLLEQECIDLGAMDLGAVVKHQLDEFSEARAVVVAQHLGAAKILRERLRRYDALLNLFRRVRYHPQVIHHKFCRFCFAGTTLSIDHNCLIAALGYHGAMSLGRQSKNVRRFVRQMH